MKAPPVITPLDPVVAYAIAAYRIELEYDKATDTWALAPAMRAHADRLASDGTLACLDEARELHTRDDARSQFEAHRLLFLVHFRGVELRMPALCREAANVCRSCNGKSTIAPKGGHS